MHDLTEFLNRMPLVTDQTRYELFKVLGDKPNLSQRDLARELGISLGKSNYCIKTLIDEGWVEVVNSWRGQNRSSLAYVLTSIGLKEKARITLEFLKHKQDEHEMLVAELDELRKEVAMLEHAREWE